MHYLRPVVTLICLLICSSWAQAQTTDSAKVNPSKPIADRVEQVDGVLAVAGHLGKKLLKEVGQKLNVVDEVPVQPRKVVMKVGPFRIERYE